jgi:hypothetical protein
MRRACGGPRSLTFNFSMVYERIPTEFVLQYSSHWAKERNWFSSILYKYRIPLCLRPVVMFCKKKKGGKEKTIYLSKFHYPQLLNDRLNWKAFQNFFLMLNIYNFNRYLRQWSDCLQAGRLVSIPDRAGDFYLLYNVQTCPGIHASFCLMGTVTLFPVVKRLGREPHHAPPSSTEVKNGGTIPPLPIYLHVVVLD